MAKFVDEFLGYRELLDGPYFILRNLNEEFNRTDGVHFLSLYKDFLTGAKKKQKLALYETFGEPDEDDRAFSEDDLKPIFGSPKGSYYIIFVQGRFDGFSYLLGASFGGYTKIDKKTCEIKLLYTSNYLDSCKDEGLEETILENLIKDSKEQGYEKMQVKLYSFSDKSKKLYEKYDFEETERDEEEKTLILTLDLTA